MKLVELAYFTDDVAVMVGFYQRLLGVEPVAQSDGMAIFMIGHTKLFIHHLYEPDDGQLPPTDHIAFEVDSVDETCTRLIGEGLALEIPPADYYWGRSAYLRDPEGHQIELTQAADETHDGEN